MLKIGISNNVQRRAKEIGSVLVEWNDNYRAPRTVVMATEMLAQAYAYRKVGRPKNYRQALPVRSGSSEFFNTENLRQAQGFVYAAQGRINKIATSTGFYNSKLDDLLDFSKQLDMCSGADLENFVNQCGYNAISEGREQIESIDLEEALKKIIRQKK